MNRELAVQRLQMYLDNFVYQLLCVAYFLKNGLEQFALDLSIHSIRSVDADESRVKRNIPELPGGPGIVRVTAKVHAVSRHEGPVTLQDKGFQLPVFPACLAHPDNMRAFHETARLGDRDQIET